MKNHKFKVLLGYTKPKQYGTRAPVYLEGFSWDCDWYWGGGYIGNDNFHSHFNGAFLETPDSRGHVLGSFYDPWTTPKDCKPENVKYISNGASVWEDITFFLDSVPKHISNNWWHIKDLYKQFYSLKDAAETFQHGGRCTSKGRTDAEINKDMADKINRHIETVIIPEIIKIVVKK